MFYLGRSCMFTKPQRTNVFKLWSLALLLVVFWFLWSHAFAQTDACHAQNTPLPANEPHKYTCETKTDTHCPDGFDDTRYGQMWCATNLECHRCMPTANTTTPVTPSTTNANGKGLQCKSDTIPNTAGTGCIPKPVTDTNTSNPPTTSTSCATNETKVDGKCVSCDTPGVCCGVKLNTNVPFIGNCIRTGTDGSTTDGTTVTETTAFPRLMWWLTKIMTTIILLVCFGGILVWGVMVSASWGSDKTASEWKKLIGKVIVAIALLGTSGIILHLINPNFFW